MNINIVFYTKWRANRGEHNRDSCLPLHADLIPSQDHVVSSAVPEGAGKGGRRERREGNYLSDTPINPAKPSLRRLHARIDVPVASR